MLKIIQQVTAFSEIRLPNHDMIREDNSVAFIVHPIPKRFNAPPKDRQRIIVFVSCNFNEFMSSEPFEVACASSRLDIVTNRDVHLIELYRMVVSVAESLKAHVLSKNIPYLVNEEFPLDQPDIIRAKLAPALHKINIPLNDVLLN